MKIALLGATGNVGSRTVTAALAAGHEVIAYARRPEAVTAAPGVTVVGGELDDAPALAAALTGADVLIASVTGSIRDKTFAQRTVPALVAAARAAGVPRIVLVSAFGAGDTAILASGLARLVYRSALRGFLADKAASEQALTESGLDWTIVYPVNLKDAPAVAEWTAVPLDRVAKVPGMPTLPYENVAETLVSVAADPATAGQRIVVTTATGWRSA